MSARLCSHCGVVSNFSQKSGVGGVLGKDPAETIKR